MIGLKFCSIVDGATSIRIRGCPLVGQWLMAYDPDAHGGLGECRFTDDVEDAMRFADAAEAEACWRQQSSVLPTVWSSWQEEATVERPNCPLMVVSVETDELP